MLAVCHLRDLNVDPTTHPRGRAYVSAASGLVRVQQRIYVVADDEHYLAEFDAGRPDARGRLIRLFEGDLPTATGRRKSLKPDLEALARLPAWAGYPWGALFGLGSGSRPNRNTGVLLALGSDGGLEGAVRRIDLAPLYAPLRIHFADLNIEGALVVGDELLLLQRGHGGGSLNACIRFAWSEALRWLLGESDTRVQASAVQRYDLGTVAGVPLCFTDGAALPGGGWVYSAVAENVGDSYNDGAYVGATIGIVDHRGTVRSTQALPPGLKVEGISADMDGDAVELTMVTDADNPAIVSQLLSAKLSIVDAFDVV